MTMEISPGHHPVVVGKGSINLRLVFSLCVQDPYLFWTLGTWTQLHHIRPHQDFYSYVHFRDIYYAK